MRFDLGVLLCAVASLASEVPVEELAALAAGDECSEGSCALNALQLRGEGTAEDAADDEDSGPGIVKCVCKKHGMYYCSRSYMKLHLCYGPCPALCSHTGGAFHMCGDLHSDSWLDRWFRKKEMHHMRCPNDAKR
eukprot:gb/GFBE01000386.1/.p1 GENE.gb/GFBE01000386.1/~~gb/GFBE01000386.1/.p1  ORF type:complete len:135 (+),score=20.51 gb/GFBE01000386.1/:1-405(+)